VALQDLVGCDPELYDCDNPVSFLRWYLWVVPHILLAVCFWGLLRRPRSRALPMFRCYLVVATVGFVCLLTPALLIPRFPVALSWYKVINIATLTATELATLAVIYELADQLLVSHLALRTVARRLMRWAIAVSLLVAAGISPLLQNASFKDPLKIFEAVDFVGSLTILGLMLTLLVFTHTLQLSWQALPLGILLGFAIDASIELSASALLSRFGHGKTLMLLDLIRTGAFHICAVIWLVYAFLPDRPSGHDRTAVLPPDLGTWNNEVQSILGK
jgi:hypothetical protein